MLSIRLTASRTSNLMVRNQARLLSSQGVIAVEKLRSVLDEYRRNK
jgi:hypothetical protein